MFIKRAIILYIYPLIPYEIPREIPYKIPYKIPFKIPYKIPLTFYTFKLSYLN